MFLQLWHCGRASIDLLHPDQGLPVAPSAIKINEDHIYTPIGKQPYETPRALETEEVPAIVEDYRRAAERAKSAGFDGVEIHSANGYLLISSYSPRPIIGRTAMEGASKIVSGS